MAGKRGARHPAENENFPILNSGQSEITHLLRDGPGCSKLLVGSPQTGYHHFSVVIFIATADAAAGVGKSAAPKSPWTSVTHIPEELRELWVATDRQTETVVLQEGFLIVHPPSGVLVAGSNNRMRAAMTRQLEPLTFILGFHMMIAPMNSPHFEAYLTTTRRVQQLIQQALSPQAQAGAPLPTLTEIVQPLRLRLRRTLPPKAAVHTEGTWRQEQNCSLESLSLLDLPSPAQFGVFDYTIKTGKAL